MAATGVARAFLAVARHKVWPIAFAMGAMADAITDIACWTSFEVSYEETVTQAQLANRL